MAQPARNLLQQAVAGFVAEAVVDVLEAVEVDEEEGELLVAPLGERKGALQRVHEHRAVGQSRELVEVRETANALLGAPRLRHVAGDAAVTGEDAVGIEHRLAGEAQVAPLAVAVAHGEREIAERLACARERVVADEIGLGQRHGAPRHARPAAQLCDARPVAVGIHARHLGEAQLGILLPVPVGGKREKATEARLAVPQPRLRLLARGDVLVDPGQAQRASRRIALHHATAAAHPAPGAVVGAHAVLDVVVGLAAGHHLHVLAQDILALLLGRERHQRLEVGMRGASLAAEHLVPPFGHVHRARGIDVHEDEVGAEQRRIEARDGGIALVFGELLAGDVAQRAAEHHHFACARRERLEQRMQPHDVAAVVDHAKLGIGVGTGGERPVREAQHALAVVGVDECGEGFRGRRPRAGIEPEQAVALLRAVQDARRRRKAEAPQGGDALRLGEVGLGGARAARALVHTGLERGLLVLERAVELGHLRRGEILRALEEIAILVGLLVGAAHAVEKCIPLLDRRRRRAFDAEARKLPRQQGVQAIHRRAPARHVAASLMRRSRRRG